ncbi:MAG: pyridoxamine 5'-phosphate oxidase family protein [Desulfatibacillaceae bacterium]
MELSDKVKNLLGSHERTNVLATSDADGRVNVGVYGSVMLDGDQGLMMMLGDNRACENLKANPYAAVVIIPHGKAGMELADAGARIYLKVASIQDSGERFDEVWQGLKARIGNAANMLKHLVLFEVTEARPILDLGQGV